MKHSNSLALESRVDAIRSLHGLESEQAETLLREAVTDPCAEIRLAGLTVLADRLDDRYLPLFQAELHDDDMRIREFASQQLKLLRSYRNGRLGVNARLSVDDCLAHLRSRKAWERERGVTSLVGVVDPRIIEPVLALAMNDRDSHWCRSAALNVLDCFDDPALLVEFESLLGDVQVGAYAAYKLSHRGDIGADDLLLAALDSEDRTVRLNAVDGVGGGGDLRVVLPLCRLLGGEDQKIAQAAIRSLAALIKRLGVATAVLLLPGHTRDYVTTTLATASRHCNIEIRSDALLLLAELDRTLGVPAVMAALEDYYARVLDPDRQTTPERFDYLQFAIFSSVVLLGDQMFREPILHLAESPDWQVKVRAAETLLALGDERLLPVLEQALFHADWTIRAEAARLLLSRGISAGWDVSIAILQLEVEDLWFAKGGLLQALSASDRGRAVGLFIDILEHPAHYSLLDEDIGWVITWLGVHGQERARESMRKWLHVELTNCAEDLVEKACRGG